MDANDRKKLVDQLKLGRRGWTMLLPKEAGLFMGKRIGMRIYTALQEGREPPLAEHERHLVEQILEHLPRLTARAEKALDDDGGIHLLMEDEEPLTRGTITIWRERQSPKRAGPWTMIIRVEDSDMGWHIEFVGTRFKEIWAGD